MKGKCDLLFCPFIKILQIQKKGGKTGFNLFPLRCGGNNILKE